MNIAENMVTNGEISRFKQNLLLSPCFQKCVRCRFFRMCLYEVKGGYIPISSSLFRHILSVILVGNISFPQKNSVVSFTGKQCKVERSFSLCEDVW